MRAGAPAGVHAARRRRVRAGLAAEQAGAAVPGEQQPGQHQGQRQHGLLLGPLPPLHCREKGWDRRGGRHCAHRVQPARTSPAAAAAAAHVPGRHRPRVVSDGGVAAAAAAAWGVCRARARRRCRRRAARCGLASSSRCAPTRRCEAGPRPSVTHRLPFFALVSLPRRRGIVGLRGSSARHVARFCRGKSPLLKNSERGGNSPLRCCEAHPDSLRQASPSRASKQSMPTPLSSFVNLSRPDSFLHHQASLPLQDP